MKTFSFLVVFILGMTYTPIFGQSKKPKTVKAMYFDLIGTLSTIKNTAEPNARAISKWHGKDAETGEDLYKDLVKKTNSTIDVCIAAIKSPAMARRQDAAQKVMDGLNSMIKADTALTGFYNRTRRYHGGNALGPDAIVSLIVGQATVVVEKILGIIDAKQIELAEELNRYKLSDWPATMVSIPAKSGGKAEVPTKPASNSTAEKRRTTKGTAERE